ncbi:MAG: hypothetical protein ICV60_08875 [Pyrinomonadaceae bacterium]|nr:hypothetical protein [Pyrinomonadaceae bacterium]
MAEVIQQYTPQFHDDEKGISYTVMAYGEMTAGGTWEGWLEFHPADKTEQTLRTGRETTQPDRAALEYWASGLEPLYFEGAFARAR